MTHAYKVTGMTCGSCEAKVKSSLLMLPNVAKVEVSKEKQSATITPENHIALSTFQNALDKKYSISATEDVLMITKSTIMQLSITKKLKL